MKTKSTLWRKETMMSEKFDFHGTSEGLDAAPEAAGGATRLADETREGKRTRRSWRDIPWWRFFVMWTT